jgi:hypothetical protein
MNVQEQIVEDCVRRALRVFGHSAVSEDGAIDGFEELFHEWNASQE